MDIIRLIAYAVAAILIIVMFFAIIYFSRLQTAFSLKKITSRNDYNLYTIDVKYKYNTEAIIDSGFTDDASFVKAVIAESAPFLPVSVKLPDFGCSAFKTKTIDGEFLMGRNYDFKYDTSALLTYCSPEDGYRSVAFGALNNINADKADKNLKTKLTTLVAPFISLDGINEEGVSIAVLTLDSKPTRQSTGKKKISTSLAIRLVLDYAATTQEAVEILSEYDMFAVNGRDYHFFITDATGDSRVVEYDCNSETREMVVTKCDAVTNYMAMYRDKVLPNQKNDVYGHGKERCDIIEEILAENKRKITRDVAWEALKASSQDPNPLDVTSNTQWSILFSNTNRSADIVLRRVWKDRFLYDLNGTELKAKDIEKNEEQNTEEIK